jgi:nitrogen fixation/metabolism regulation signal transduction histidine kinase
MSGIFFIFYQLMVVSLIVFGLVLAFRFVRAVEKSAEALETIARGQIDKRKLD